MNAILRCTESSNDYFTKGKAYLFVDGILTCNNPGYGTNLYFTPNVLHERRDTPINTLEDIHAYFEKYHENVKFEIDQGLTDNWGIK